MYLIWPNLAKNTLKKSLHHQDLITNMKRKRTECTLCYATVFLYLRSRYIVVVRVTVTVTVSVSVSVMLAYSQSPNA